MKKFFALALTVLLAFSLVACTGGAPSSAPAGSESAGGSNVPAADVDTYAIDKTLKIGVLVADATSSEALAFRSYFMDYIGAQYDVEFIYSDELADAQAEITALENFINQGVQAVASFSSNDVPAQADMCEDAGIYFAVATGTMGDDTYNEYKGYEYYVGSIGPGLQTEFDVGHAMAKNYIDQGKTNYLIFGGAAAYGTEMHIYRVAGMIAALCEADDTTNYDGATDKDGIVAAMSGTGLDTTKFASDTFSVDYMDGYNMDDAWFGMIAEKMAAPGLEVVLAVGNGVDFFSPFANGGEIKVGTVDSFTTEIGEAYEQGLVDWVAGKFNASIGPVFVGLVNAVNGVPMRTVEGDAYRIDQGYWEAATYEEYETYYNAVNDAENPVYNKAILDQYISTPGNVVSYDTFAAFVAKSDYDTISSMS